MPVNTRSIKMHSRLRLCLFFIAAMGTFARPMHLTTEHRANPLGIDVTEPRFSWQSDDRGRNWVQSAWQILVASTPDGLPGGKADVWDSGRKGGSESTGVAYGGPALRSGHRYYWAVRVWDGKGRPEQSEESAWWEWTPEPFRLEGAMDRLEQPGNRRRRGCHALDLGAGSGRDARAAGNRGGLSSRFRDRRRSALGCFVFYGTRLRLVGFRERHGGGC